MKKLFLTAIASFLLTTLILAQEGNSFEKGVSDINIGVGIGNLYWGSGFSNSLGVNPTASYEYGVTDRISIGGNISYSAAKFSSGGYEIKYSGILIGPRGAYHFATSPKFDPYVGATLGYVIVSVTDNSGGSFGGAKASGVGLGAFLGARYFPSSSFGFHAEIGYTSFSFLTAGISFKF